MTEKDKKSLLKIAREAVKSGFSGEKFLQAKPESDFLLSKRGAFVTIHGKNGVLRGCIGMIQSDQPLYQTVRDMALEAAFHDTRFDAIKAGELESIRFEISVLTPFKKIKDPKEIELGRHGVMVKQGASSGVFLPQVAIETGWGIEEFMGHLCEGKAGLSFDCWKNSKADIYTFEAEIIQE